MKLRITRDGVTREQNAQPVAGVTALLCEVLGKRFEHALVVIDEVDPDNRASLGCSRRSTARKRAASFGEALDGKRGNSRAR